MLDVSLATFYMSTTFSVESSWHPTTEPLFITTQLSHPIFVCNVSLPAQGGVKHGRAHHSDIKRPKLSKDVCPQVENDLVQLIQYICDASVSKEICMQIYSAIPYWPEYKTF